MRRIDALAVVADADALTVCNIGYPSRELFAVGDRPGIFYMLGSMGLASSIGLGLSLVLDDPVVAVEGDGSLLMNLGSLTTIAHFGPPHLVVVVLDNEAYGSTGNQPTHSARGTDLAAIARATAIPRVASVDTRSALADVLAEVLQDEEAGPAVVVAAVEPGNADVPVIPIGPRAIRDRFRSALDDRRPS